MKKALILAGLLGLTSAAFGQGAINFITFNSGQGVNGLGYAGTVGSTLAGATYSGQLYVNTGASIDAAGTGSYIGSAVAFRNNPTTTLPTGIISGGTVTFGNPGQTVWVQLRAWLGSAGASYDAALPSGLVGTSNAIQVSLGGGTLPPAYLTGLTPFAIAVPEPSTIALGLLGLGFLAIRRRK